MVYDQYFDKSLNYESELYKKNELLSNFYQSKTQNISFSSFKNMHKYCSSTKVQSILLMAVPFQLEGRVYLNRSQIDG